MDSNIASIAVTPIVISSSYIESSVSKDVEVTREVILACAKVEGVRKIF